jgi:SAM-dependent methyltransferase
MSTTSNTTNLTSLYALLITSIFAKHNTIHASPFDEENNNNVPFFDVDFPYPRWKEKRKIYQQPIQESKQSHEAWNDFFSTHAHHFFMDRHYFTIEFPYLTQRIINNTEETTRNNSSSNITGIRIIELGCGTGASALPLLKEFPNKQSISSYVGIDCSFQALSLFKLTQDDQQRCEIMELSMSSPNLVPLSFSDKKLFDVCLMIFSLSAIEPSKMNICMENAFQLLRPGGILSFRDYSWGDLAQKRFAPAQRKGRGWYVRQDSTFSFFFTESGLIRLAQDAGFQILFVKTLCKTVENKASNLIMKRMWLSAEFIKPV